MNYNLARPLTLTSFQGPETFIAIYTLVAISMPNMNTSIGVTVPITSSVSVYTKVLAHNLNGNFKTSSSQWLIMTERLL